MLKAKKIGVIGGGFGGIAAALRMRAKGYEVILLERGDQLGGRARVFKQEGHVFDAGPTVITAPHLLNELFELFGKQAEDYFQLKSLDFWYRYYFSDNTFFDYVAKEQQLLKNIQALSPEDVEGFKKLIVHAEKIFQKGFVELGDSPFLTISSMLVHAIDLIKIQFHCSLYKAVCKYIKNDKLRKVFTTQTLLVGGHPFKTSSIYLIILALERAYGCHFCMGGTNSLVAAFEQLMNEVGIQIYLNSTVTALYAESKQVTSVEINNQDTLSCDYVIYNGDPAYAYSHLIKNKTPVKIGWLRRKRLNSLKFSPGLCVFYFGTSRVYPEVPLHSILYGDSYKELLDDIFNHFKFNSDLSLYLYRPTAIDKSLAPAGRDSFYVLAPVPNLQANIDWKRFEDEFKQHLVSILEARLLPGLSTCITTEKLVTPEYFSQELLSMHGAGFSIQPIMTQSAYFRFHNQSRYLHNLYFVGAGTHPGAGVPGVLLSAKLVGKLVPDAVA